MACSQVAHATPAAILLDFAQAFLSLGHEWVWEVLWRLDINPRFLAFTMALYDNLTTTISHKAPGSKALGFTRESGRVAR